MNRDDIIRMASKAGFRMRGDGWFDGGFHNEKFERFAALVAAAEREACIALCVEHWEFDGNAMECADAIRAREKE